tara:strand:+ start:6488 stop:7114 length:627 start_codon:yes stop_codon:yes gene_type:complete
MTAPSYPLNLPTSPSNFRTSEWRIVRTVAVSTSIYDYSSQSADFGGAMWTTTVGLPPMKRDEAYAWQVFFMQLHGRAGTFLLGDPDSKTIRGALDSTINVNGTFAVGAYSIGIENATASTVIFKAGDYIQFGSGATQKLHMITANCTSNGSGQATVEIEPPLKTALANDSAIIYSSTKAVMRMDSNELSWTADQISVYGISFSCSEVI